MEKWGSFNTLMDNATIHDLIRRTAGDLVASSYAIVLTGAGISTESGVADFRGPKGIWTTNKQAEAQATRGTRDS